MAKIGVPVRTARAMASDGRLDTTVASAVGAQVQLGEERVVAHLGDDDLLELGAERGEQVDASGRG